MAETLLSTAVGAPSHDDRILAVVRARGPMSRAEVGRAVGLSRATVSETVGRLLERGALTATAPRPQARRERGRPVELLALDPAAGYVMGVEFSHALVYVAVADAAHEVVARGVRRHRPDLDGEGRCDQAFDLIEEIGASSGVRLDLLHGVGVGLVGPAGTARRHPGRVFTWSSDHDMQRYHRTVETIIRRFEQRFASPILVETCTKFATLAEAIWGAGEEGEDLLYVRVTEGIGGGMVLAGRLHVGPDGSAGDLGHVTVDPAGPQCRCGKRGCLETVASVEAVVNDCARLRPQITGLPDVRAWLDAGDEAVRLVVGRAGRALGSVLATAATIVNPTAIVVGGQLPETVPEYLHWARQAFARQVSHNGIRDLTIRPARLGEEAAALGAVAALFHRSTLLEGYPRLTLSCGPATETPHPADPEGRGDTTGDPEDATAADADLREAADTDGEAIDRLTRDRHPALLADLLAVRSAVEPLAARDAARRPEARTVADLEAECERMAEAVRVGDVAAYAAADTAWHARLVRAADNPVFRNLAGTVAAVLAARNRSGLMPEEPCDASVQAHRSVVRAVADGRRDEAQEEMRALIDSAGW